MKPETKVMLGKQIAYGYGVAFSVILAMAGVFLIWVATRSILYDYNDMIEIKEQYTNETYLLENRITPAMAKEMIGLYEHSYDLTCQNGRWFILAGLGLLILAECIAYVPMSLYAKTRWDLPWEINKNKVKPERP